MSVRSDFRAAEASPPDVEELWPALFGRQAPVEIEIGSGDGVFLLALAARHPDRDFLGIERSPSKGRRLEARIVRSGLSNVRAVRADATCLIPAVIPRASVTVYHVYFPDPWPKRGHAFRRIFSPPFVAALARTLATSGRAHVATDVAAYAERIWGAFLADGSFVKSIDGDEHPGLQTSFARKYRAVGRRLHAATFVRVQPGAASKMRSM